MICPYCGKEMKQGYIKSPQQLFWSKFKELGTDNETIRLSGNFWSGFARGFSVESCYCPECKKIITSIE